MSRQVYKSETKNMQPATSLHTNFKHPEILHKLLVSGVLFFMNHSSTLLCDLQESQKVTQSCSSLPEVAQSPPCFPVTQTDPLIEERAGSCSVSGATAAAAIGADNLITFFQLSRPGGRPARRPGQYVGHHLSNRV